MRRIFIKNNFVKEKMKNLEYSILGMGGNIPFSKWNIFKFMPKLRVYYVNTWPLFFFFGS